MKKEIFIVVSAVADDDGNLYGDVESVHNTYEEAVNALKVLHDQVITYFENPEDDYEEGDNYYDTVEADDYSIRRTAGINRRVIEI